MNQFMMTQRDDFKGNRLFHYIMLQSGLPILQCRRIKDNIYFLQCKDGNRILKGYRSFQKLHAQINLHFELEEVGFHTYANFLPFPNGQFIVPFDNDYYGLMKWIPHQNVLSYRNGQDRKEGLSVLNFFHEKSSSLSVKIKNQFPTYHLIPKWFKRLEEFKQNKRQIRTLIGYDKTEDLIAWGELALDYLKSSSAFEKIEKDALIQKNTMIHGDLASHNFLRGADRKIYIIDFDLAAIAPAAIDLLQYSNRILPHLDWTYEELGKLKLIKHCLQNRWFVLSLIYPTDIYRECNRSLRTNNIMHEQFLQNSLNQYEKRKQFVQKILNMIT